MCRKNFFFDILGRRKTLETVPRSAYCSYKKQANHLIIQTLFDNLKMPKSAPSEPASRSALRQARRVIIKAGTSVLTNENGQVSLTRIGAITEQIAELVNDGVEVIFVSSGAVGMGKRVLRKQGRKTLSLQELHTHEEGSDVPGSSMDNRLRDSASFRPKVLGMNQSSSFADFLDDTSCHKTQKQKHQKQYDSACAAAGLFELMNLYSSLFGQYEMTPSQILLTQGDFQDSARLQHLTYTVERLLSLGIVPIVNENDAVSGNIGYTNANAFSDNDSLAALCARTLNAEVLVMLTDVPGVYDRPPTEKGSSLIKFYKEDQADIKIGEKSTRGRGGMGAKIEAALGAVKPGSLCNACVVVGGDDLNAIRSIVGKHLDGEPKGTLFVTPGTKLFDIACDEEIAEKVCRQDCVEQSKLINKCMRLTHFISNAKGQCC